MAIKAKDDLLRKLNALQRLAKTEMVLIPWLLPGKDVYGTYGYPISEEDYAILKPVFDGFKLVSYELDTGETLRKTERVIEYVHCKIGCQDYVVPCNNYWANLMEITDLFRMFTAM